MMDQSIIAHQTLRSQWLKEAVCYLPPDKHDILPDNDNVFLWTFVKYTTFSYFIIREMQIKTGS